MGYRLSESHRNLRERVREFGEAELAPVARKYDRTAEYPYEEIKTAADEAVQVYGGPGYVEDYLVEKYYRDARITKIYEGTNEIQKNIISNELL